MGGVAPAPHAVAQAIGERISKKKKHENCRCTYTSYSFILVIYITSFSSRLKQGLFLRSPFSVTMVMFLGVFFLGTGGIRGGRSAASVPQVVLKA